MVAIRRIPPEIAAQLADHFSADALSDREIQVLREVAAGSSNKLVADKLFISEDTGEGPHEEYPHQAAGERSNARCNDRRLKRGFLDG